MDTTVSTPRTTFLTLELSRSGRPVGGSLSTVAWRLVISEAARCGIREVRFVGAARSGGEVEELSAFASSAGLNVAPPAGTDPYDRCGDRHAVIFTDGGLSHCLHSPLIAGNVRDGSLDELLNTRQWLRTAGAPCPARSRARVSPMTEPATGASANRTQAPAGGEGDGGGRGRLEADAGTPGS